MLWRYHGDLNAAYAHTSKTVFRPIEERDASISLQHQIGSLTGAAREDDLTSCGARWMVYCESMAEAIDTALARHARVLVVTQPYISDLHVEQQNSLRAMLRTKFAGTSTVKYINLGRLIDLND